MSSKTKIINIVTDKTILDKIKNYLSIKNKLIDNRICDIYKNIGEIYEIRWDIAFCQSLLETGNFAFGNDVKVTQYNFCGLGAIGGGACGASFNNIEDGVEAHIQHLFAYASTKELPKERRLIDPRFKYVNRGFATHWEDLSGKWAASKDYHIKILSIFDSINKIF